MFFCETYLRQTSTDMPWNSFRKKNMTKHVVSSCGNAWLFLFLKACGWPGHVSAASASPRSLKLKKNKYGYVTFFRCFRGSMWYDVLVCDIRVDIASDIRGGEFSGVSLNQLVCPLFFFPLFCRDYRSRLYAVYYTVISPFVFKLVAYVVELRYGKFLVRPSNLIK